jgi:hypothetical protein
VGLRSPVPEIARVGSGEVFGKTRQALHGSNLGKAAEFGRAAEERTASAGLTVRKDRISDGG